jgi:predicted ferric reductase
MQVNSQADDAAWTRGLNNYDFEDDWGDSPSRTEGHGRQPDSFYSSSVLELDRAETGHPKAGRRCVGHLDTAAFLSDDFPSDPPSARSINASIAEIRRLRSKRARILYATFFANLGCLLAIFVFGAGIHIVQPGDVLTTVARGAALVGTYLLLVQLLLVTRIPVLDRLYGMDRLVRWHKRNAHISFCLIVMHVVFVIIGRAMDAQMSSGRMALQVLSYPFMIPALISFVSIVAVVVTSAGVARSKLKHGTWMLIHMWTYLGVVLSFGHEIYGPDFTHHVLAQVYVADLYVITFALIFFYRLVVPVYHTFRHQLRVTEVVQESDNVVSIYMTGFNLDKLSTKPGQFFYWRFLTGREWRESHPYSVSSVPDSKTLRITVKTLGDASARMKELPVDTWVAFEGPFGGFTADFRQTPKALLVAGGVGVTAIRSLLEGLPAAPGHITVIYRVDKLIDAVLIDELETLAARRSARLLVISGKRSEYPAHQQPLSADHLEYIVPEIYNHDVYICASAGLTETVCTSLRELGVPDRQVHFESFV